MLLTRCKREPTPERDFESDWDERNGRELAARSPMQHDEGQHSPAASTGSRAPGRWPAALSLVLGQWARRRTAGRDVARWRRPAVGVDVLHSVGTEVAEWKTMSTINVLDQRQHTHHEANAPAP